MAKKQRTVADRQKSLQPTPEGAGFTLAGVRRMYAGVGGQEFHCTINGYCRTQIFEFPGIDFHPDGDEPHHTIYSSSLVQAVVTTNLVSCFTDSTFSRHYAISPCLRYMVKETDERVKSQKKDSTPVFLVIEEYNQLPSVEMNKGECSIQGEVVTVDGEKVTMLHGGRDGEEFVTAWPTADGAWPELPDNQQTVNLILAGVRVGQQTPEPIKKHLGLECLVTDDGRFVTMAHLTASARVSIVTAMDATTYRERLSEIGGGITAIEQDIAAPHVALLVNAMYSDEHKDDSYRRLRYLQLWQSLADAGRPYLKYKGDIREDKAVVAGKKTLKELGDYRDDIAHWWTDTIDENFLADLQRTINELMRRRYF